MEKEKQGVMSVPNNAPHGEIPSGTAHSMLRYAGLEKDVVVGEEAEGEALVAIERGCEGWYWLYTINNRPCNINGYGKTLQDAKRNFTECYQNLKKELELGELTFRYVYSVSAILAEFPFINPGKLADYLGANRADMQNYNKGRIFIGEKWEQKIRKGLSDFAHSLLQMTEPNQ